MDAIRKRVQRGTIAHEKDSDGRVWILLDTDQDPTGHRPDTGQPPSDSSALISAKDETIATLRDQLEAERQAHGEARRIIAGLVERIPPAIEAPARVPTDARESPETVEEDSEGAESPGPLRERPRRPHRGPGGAGCSGSGSRVTRGLTPTR